jgi:hypothetical protein
LKYYLYGLYPDSATIFNIFLHVKGKIVGKVKMETTAMWVLTIIILKDIKCFQIWAYFERLGINFNFENFQNKIFPFFHFKNHPKYACTISPDELNCDVRVWHGKTRDFIIDWTIYWVRLFEVSGFEPKMGFFNLQISGKLTGLSNQFEPSIVFDRSKFDL